MTAHIPTYFFSLSIGIAGTLMAHQLFFGKNPAAEWIQAYRKSWESRMKILEIGGIICALPLIQFILIPLLLIGAVLFGSPKLFGGAATVIVIPWFWAVRAEKKRRQHFEDDLDGFLVALADSLTAVPNLSEALASLYPNLVQPIRNEVGLVLAEIRLGRPIDDALQQMSKRARISGLDAAVGALILSRRVGGDIPRTLRRIAETIREMARLEGVIRTKTAEGRTQALVIGLMPPALVFYFEKVSPEWLAPMWNDPLGWILLGSAAAAEIAALALIHKIMAVDI